MQNQRKHNATCSPASSSNQKRRKNHLRTGAATKGFSETSFISEYENENSPGTRRRLATSRNSAGKGGSGGGAKQDSSRGRCATPSPLFSSPVSSLSSDISSDSQVSTGAGRSFATANQSFSIKSNDAKKTGEGIGRRAGVKNSIADRGREEAGREKHRRRVRKQQPSERSVSYGSTIFDGEGRLTAMGEGEGDDCFSGGSNFGTQSDNSDIDSMVEAWRRKQAALVRSRPIGAPPEAEMSKSEAEDSIVSWKEARTTKLINKLKREEAIIDALEKKKKTEAQKEMVNLEAKLEKKREVGMEKMKRKMELARREAERKKLKEREATSCQIAKLEASFEKMTLARYKAPWWRLLFS